MIGYPSTKSMSTHLFSTLSFHLLQPCVWFEFMFYFLSAGALLHYIQSKHVKHIYVLLKGIHSQTHICKHKNTIIYITLHLRSFLTWCDYKNRDFVVDHLCVCVCLGNYYIQPCKKCSNKYLV